MRKYQTNSNWGAFYKKSWPLLYQKKKGGRIENIYINGGSTTIFLHHSRSTSILHFGDLRTPFLTFTAFQAYISPLTPKHSDGSQILIFSLDFSCTLDLHTQQSAEHFILSPMGPSNSTGAEQNSPSSHPLPLYSLNLWMTSPSTQQGSL